MKLKLEELTALRDWLNDGGEMPYKGSDLTSDLVETAMGALTSLGGAVRSAVGLTSNAMESYSRVAREHEVLFRVAREIVGAPEGTAVQHLPDGQAVLVHTPLGSIRLTVDLIRNYVGSSGPHQEYIRNSVRRHELDRMGSATPLTQRVERIEQAARQLTAQDLGAITNEDSPF